MIYISKAIFSRDGGSNTITKLQLKEKRKNTQGSQVQSIQNHSEIISIHIAASLLFWSRKRESCVPTLCMQFLQSSGVKNLCISSCRLPNFVCLAVDYLLKVSIVTQMKQFRCLQTFSEVKNTHRLHSRKVITFFLILPLLCSMDTCSSLKTSLFHFQLFKARIQLL